MVTEVLAAFLTHAKVYYGATSRELSNLVRVTRSIRESLTAHLTIWIDCFI